MSCWLVVIATNNWQQTTDNSLLPTLQLDQIALGIRHISESDDPYAFHFFGYHLSYRPPAVSDDFFQYGRHAALRAGEIAESAEFFSFGTNDLTQTTLGISRDDAASFLGPYTAKGILPTDPFVTLDQEGVGELVKMAAERGRATRPGMKLGICGEHGGDPASIAFCEKAGLDYVSCSPFRVPIARLAAAQAALGEKASSTA